MRQIYFLTQSIVNIRDSSEIYSNKYSVSLTLLIFCNICNVKAVAFAKSIRADE